MYHKVLISVAIVSFVCEASAYEIVGFRGLHQTTRDNAPTTGCTAQSVNYESHTFIENTIPSIREAFRIGATVGHFNIRRSKDDQLVSFHDSSLECRTDLVGNIHDLNLSELRTADVGYGYSPDNGKSFPVRGLGKGLMPTIQEVLAAFPNRPFAINDKDADSETVDLLSKVLLAYPETERGRFYYLGEAAALARQKIPGIQVVASTDEAKKCVTEWLSASGGNVPQSCHDTIIAFPVSAARKFETVLPKFISDLHSVNSKVWIFEANSKETTEFSKAFAMDAIGTYRIDHTIGVLHN